MEPPGNNLCPGCQQPLTSDNVGGLCPACLIKSGFYSQTPAGASAGGQRRNVPSVEELRPLFPQLEIEGYIGRGGMGAVYRARQAQLGRTVALKILLNDTQDVQFAQRFQREAQALARLSHPNIVTVHDFGRAGDFYFLLMEFIDGMNLRQLEQTRRLSPDEALAIVPPICDALQYAHNNGIVHRDIKPENILLTTAGQVKIADFGIAKMMDASAPQTLTGDQRIGTPHYMAPEQVEKPATVDHRADIYSLGVVFYEMLTGELPLGRFAAPSRKVQVDVRLDEIVLRALEKEPELRFQNVSEMKTGVTTLGSDPAYAALAAVSAGDSSTTSSAYSDRRKRRPMLLLGGMAFSVMVTLCFGLYEGPHSSSPWFWVLFGFTIALGFRLYSIISQIYGEGLREGDPRSDVRKEPDPVNPVSLLVPGLGFSICLALAVHQYNGLSTTGSWFWLWSAVSVSFGYRFLHTFLQLIKAKASYGRVLGLLVFTILAGLGCNWLIQRSFYAPVTSKNYAGSSATLVAVALPAPDDNTSPTLWNGNGQSLDQLPPDLRGLSERLTERMSSSDSREIDRRFVFQLVRGISADPEDDVILSKVNGKANTSRQTLSPDARGIIIAANFEQNQKTAEVRLGIPMRFWNSGQFVTTPDYYQQGMILSQPFTDKNQICLTVSLDSPDEMLVRIVGLDAQGKEHKSNGDASRQLGNLSQTTYRFPPGVEIEKYRIDTRRIEWKVFSNLRLFPREGLAAAASRPPAPAPTPQPVSVADAEKSPSRAWQSDPYVAPDFESYFLDNRAWGAKLDALWDSPGKDYRPDDEILETVRKGLRTCRNHPTLILAWIGNRFIWNQKNQNPDAIELMYHAADFPNPMRNPGEVSHYAVYFGLSTVKEKSPAILRTLVDLCMTVDDPNTLSRVAWGVRTQRTAALEYLDAYDRSSFKSQVERSRDVRRILLGDLNAFEWHKTWKNARPGKISDTPTTPTVTATINDKPVTVTLTAVYADNAYQPAWDMDGNYIVTESWMSRPSDAQTSDPQHVARIVDVRVEMEKTTAPWSVTGLLSPAMEIEVKTAGSNFLVHSPLHSLRLPALLSQDTERVTATVQIAEGPWFEIGKEGQGRVSYADVVSSARQSVKLHTEFVGNRLLVTPSGEMPEGELELRVLGTEKKSYHRKTIRSLGSAGAGVPPPWEIEMESPEDAARAVSLVHRPCHVVHLPDIAANARPGQTATDAMLLLPHPHIITYSSTSGALELIDSPRARPVDDPRAHLLLSDNGVTSMPVVRKGTNVEITVVSGQVWNTMQGAELFNNLDSILSADALVPDGQILRPGAYVFRTDKCVGMILLEEQSFRLGPGSGATPDSGTFQIRSLGRRNPLFR